MVLLVKRAMLSIFRYGISRISNFGSRSSRGVTGISSQLHAEFTWMMLKTILPTDYGGYVKNGRVMNNDI